MKRKALRFSDSRYLELELLVVNKRIKFKTSVWNYIFHFTIFIQGTFQ